MFTAANVILALKIAVSAVTVLLVLSLVALAQNKPRLHGRINGVFFVLTMIAVLGFEVIIRFINPEMTSSFTSEEMLALRIHLGFSIPSAALLPLMLYTGKHVRSTHKKLSILFGLLWLGTFVTGMFFLPTR